MSGSILETFSPAFSSPLSPVERVAFGAIKIKIDDSNFLQHLTHELQFGLRNSSELGGGSQECAHDNLENNFLKMRRGLYPFAVGPIRPKEITLFPFSYSSTELCHIHKNL